jgi:ubiquinone/menaquinone biosynthesis C-methylase UbiE
MDTVSNLDRETVRGFGEEWTHYDQRDADPGELQSAFARYFSIFPWSSLPARPAGFDLGCGSGRWAKLVAPRVARLHCFDASEAALRVARGNLREQTNCEFVLSSVELPLPDESMDFGYSLGVLHHVPDTAAAIRALVRKLKPGAPLLLYLYYAFDNRPAWFRGLWRVTNAGRRVLSRAPFRVRLLCTQLVAAAVYWPLARFSRLLEQAGFSVASIPLSFYRHHSFYTMRTDALDRFGTRLEQRFTQSELRRMMEAAGLERITFSANEPFWCAVGYRRVSLPEVA